MSSAAPLREVNVNQQPVVAAAAASVDHCGVSDGSSAIIQPFCPSYDPQARGTIDPTVCPEYVDDIVTYLLQKERTMMRDPHYIANRQTEVTERMRMILVDWLVDVALKFKVHAETFYLTVDIVDRYLMCAPVERSQLQLVGVTAMLIAAKHEEIWAPEVNDCIYISANTYTREEVINMERKISTELNFRFTVPTSYPFLCNLLDRVGAEPRPDDALRCCGSFFMEAAALDYPLLEYLPSQIASGVVYASLLTVCPPPANDGQLVWLPQFVRACRTPLELVAPCAARLVQTTRTLTAPNSRYQAVRRKYSSSRWQGVATLPLPEAVPEIEF